VRVRPAIVDDADPLARAMAAVADEGSWLAAEAPVDLAATALRFHTAIVSPEHSVWVLVDDDAGGRVVGCASLHPTPADGVASLGMLIVAGARGRGDGRALLEAALAGARRGGAHKVELEVWIDNARAIAFYARAGFAVEGVRRDHYRRRDGSLRSVLIMATAV
jgi:RimJ/RimL family protein N-acetyltransferase